MASAVGEMGPLLYASDDCHAEKGEDEVKNQGTDTPLPRGSGTSPRTYKNPRKSSSKTSLADAVTRRQDDAIDFREDAKVWYLYLEDAEREAKERAELWRTGLDSLLIFAGLFAGVVSSFVIDARPDLHSDSEQRLLDDIREVLQSGSINEAMNTPVSARWISTLWTISLYITLFGSTMGVLAKAWLAKFVPATTRREAKDAYQRYALDRQAERWYLREVITLVPLLVQVALFLFLIGFVLQSYADDLTIGHVILVFCASGGVLYLIMTILPLFVASAPFDTPFSDFLLWGKDLLLASVRRKPFVDLPGQLKADINEGLADILYSKLIKSPKQLLVDEAITEIASTTFKNTWITFFCQTETPQILLSRFRNCTTATSDMPPEQRNETLRACLLVLLRFAEAYETEVGPRIQDKAVPEEFQILADVLRDSLEPENPLHRWNRLPEDLRPLAFSVRAQVLKLMPPSEQADFSLNELSDRPWEMAIQDIHSRHRFPFVLAACSGIFQGQPNLKIVSAAILALSLSKAASSTAETGRATEWTGILHATERAKVYELAPFVLARLQKVTARRWEDLTLESDPGGLQAGSESIPREKRLLGCLLDCLSADRPLQCHAIRLLHSMSYNHSDCALLAEAETLLDLRLGTILSIAMYGTDNDEHAEVMSEATQLLVNLSMSDPKLYDLIQSMVIDEIERSVDGGAYFLQGKQTIDFISACFIARYPDLFYGWFVKVLPSIVHLGLREYPSGIHCCDVWELLSVSLPPNSDVQRIVPEYNGLVKKSIIEDIRLTLDSGNTWRQYLILQVIYDLLLGGDFPPMQALILDIMETSIQHIVKIATSPYDVTGRGVAQDIIRLMSESDLFDSVKIDPLAVLEGSTDSSFFSDQRRAGLDIVDWRRTRVSEWNPAVYKILLEIGCNSVEEDVYFRQRCLRLVEDIWVGDNLEKTEETVAAVKSIIVSNSGKIVDESQPEAQEAWLNLLGCFAKHASFSEIMPVYLGILVKDYGIPVRGIKERLTANPPADDKAFYDAAEEAIPPDLSVTLSVPHQWETVARWLELLLTLQQLDGFTEIGEELIAGNLDRLNEAVGFARTLDTETRERTDSPVQDVSLGPVFSPVQFLTEFNSNERISWVQLISVLAQYRPDRVPWVPEFIIRLAAQDPDYEVRRKCVSSLLSLVTQTSRGGHFTRELATHFSLIADKGDIIVRSLLTSLLSALAEYEPSMIPDALVKEMLTLAWDDAERYVRYGAIVALYKLASGSEGQRCCKVISQDSFDTRYESRLTDASSDSWKWLQLRALCMQSQESHAVSQLLDVSLQSEESFTELRTDILVELLQDDSHRDSTASKLAQTLVAAMRNTDTALRERAYSLLGSLLSLLPPTDNPSISPAELWLDIVVFLSRGDEFQTATKVLERALKDVPSDGVMFLNAMGYNEKRAEAFHTVLSRSLSVALKLETNEELRSSAVNLFGRMMVPTSVKPKAGVYIPYSQSYAVLVGRNNDAQSISRLVDICMKEEDITKRSHAENSLECAIRCEFARFAIIVKAALSKVIDSALTDTNLGPRYIVIELLDSLTVKLSQNHETAESARFFRDEVAILSISNLLKVVLTGTGGPSPTDLRAYATSLVLSLISRSDNHGPFTIALWTVIPPLIPAITVDGKETVLEFAEKDACMNAETAASVAKALVPIFRDGSSFARATAIDLLSSLYSKHGKTTPDLINFALPEMVALALDERDSIGAVRATAMSLLVATHQRAPVSWYHRQSVAPHTMKLMALLKNESLRPSAIKLLSTLAADPRVRKTITIRIIDTVTSPVSANETMESHAELLSQLVVEGRFMQEPTDYLILLLLPSILARQQFWPFRTIMQAALWVWHSKEFTWGSEVPEFPTDLVEWFKFALFGRHATAYEVQTWCSRCQNWLSAQGVNIARSHAPEASFAVENEPDQLADGGPIHTVEGVAVAQDALIFDSWNPEFIEFALDSPHEVSYQSNTYPTALHLYESMKYLPKCSHIADCIRTCDAGYVRGTTAQYYSWQREDWNEVAVQMLDEVLWNKFTQNTHLKDRLLQLTGNKELRYNDPDPFLGYGWIGSNYSNELGKGLMRLRERLREEEGAGSYLSESQA